MGVDRCRSGGGRECPSEHRHTDGIHIAAEPLGATPDIALDRRHPKRSVGLDCPGRSHDKERLENTLAVFVPWPIMRREAPKVNKACLTPLRDPITRLMAVVQHHDFTHVSRGRLL